MPRPRIIGREDRFRLRLMKSADPKPRAARPVALSISTRGQTVRGEMLKPTPRWHQRVTVKIKYRERYGAGPKADKSYAAALKRQVAYNTRTDSKSKAERIEPAPAFNARHERIDAQFAVREWGADRRYWKLILSPERGNDMKDFLGFVRETMTAVERDVLTGDERKMGEALEWVGAIHSDTNHRHAHVILRGRVGDRDLTLNKAYLSHGIRARAAEVATRHLGYRMSQERLSVPDADFDSGIEKKGRQDRQQEAQPEPEAHPQQPKQERHGGRFAKWGIG
jgi:hypothetical protein